MAADACEICGNTGPRAMVHNGMPFCSEFCRKIWAECQPQGVDAVSDDEIRVAHDAATTTLMRTLVALMARMSLYKTTFSGEEITRANEDYELDLTMHPNGYAEVRIVK